MQGGLLALDLATVSGWAYGRIPAVGPTALEVAANKPPQPASGVIRVQSIQGLGHFLSEFEDRLGALMDAKRPAGLIIEAPILPKLCNFETTCKLMSLAGIAQLQAARRGIRWVKLVQPTSVKKSFAGSGKAKKPDMMAACDARGWTYATHDEADALGVWVHGCELYRQERRA